MGIWSVSLVAVDPLLLARSFRMWTNRSPPVLLCCVLALVWGEDLRRRHGGSGVRPRELLGPYRYVLARLLIRLFFSGRQASCLEKLFLVATKLELYSELLSSRKNCLASYRFVLAFSVSCVRYYDERSNGLLTVPTFGLFP